MKTKLFLLFFFSILKMEAQAPIITSDNILMCPYTEGTAEITNPTGYDEIQWYYKYWFLDTPFEPIEGANDLTFTYDWYTYDQAQIKVIVVKGGEVLESNIITIDSYAWSSLFVMYEPTEDMIFNPDTETLSICEGETLTLSINSPYTVVRWYKDNELLEDETGTSLVVSEAGVYFVEAAPGFCPESFSNGLPMAFEFRNCNMGLEKPITNDFKIYPNPVKSNLTISLNSVIPNTLFEIYDSLGKVLKSGTISELETNIFIEDLSNGIYFIKIKNNDNSNSQSFIKM